jgi:catechol 2,3-dioxygenase-like lactoylglutathione lyase family enzyme
MSRESDGANTGPQATEVLGIDHVYLAVRAIAVSERFYDLLLAEVLGFRKSYFKLNGEPHVNYYNRHFGFALRPADPGTPSHDPRAPGLHHFCFRVDQRSDVERVAAALRAGGVAASEPRLYPEYAPDYWATFFTDPDGIRLEVTNFRAERRARFEHQDE